MHDFWDEWGGWILMAAWWLFVCFCAFHREIEAWIGSL